MRPQWARSAKFDLVIIPQHDRPSRRENIISTLGALNLIDEDYLKEESEKLKLNIQGQINKTTVGLLLGGDNKRYALTYRIVSEVVSGLKQVCLDLDWDMLASTSRRTPSDIEGLVKSELEGFDKCRLLVIANERNIPEAVGGILGFRILSLFPGRAFLWFQRRFLQENMSWSLGPRPKACAWEINTACSWRTWKKKAVFISWSRQNWQEKSRSCL